MLSEPGTIEVMGWKLFRRRLMDSISPYTWWAIERVNAVNWLRSNAPKLETGETLEQANG